MTPASFPTPSFPISTDVIHFAKIIRSEDNNAFAWCELRPSMSFGRHATGGSKWYSTLDLRESTMSTGTSTSIVGQGSVI